MAPLATFGGLDLIGICILCIMLWGCVCVCCRKRKKRAKIRIRVIATVPSEGGVPLNQMPLATPPIRPPAPTAPPEYELQPVCRDAELSFRDAPPSYDASVAVPSGSSIMPTAPLEYDLQ